MKVSCLDLFITFSKIGLFTFGGGYAMIPLIQREVVDDKEWISSDELLDVVAIAESTPGPIAINAATFIGRKTAGIKGAVCATLGVTLPSFFIILIISYVLKAFEDLKLVQYAFFGVRAGVLALIFKALVTLFGQVNKSVLSYVLIAVSFVLSGVLGVNAAFVILLCGIVGIIASLVGRRKA